MESCFYIKRYKLKRKIKFDNYLDVIQFGFYGIQSLQFGFILSSQIEVIRFLITRITKRICFLIIRVFFIHPITKKSLKSRMGKGVGAVKYWIAYIKKGTTILEISNITKKLGIILFRCILKFISLKIGFIHRRII